MNAMKLCVIGGGKMAEALIGGLIDRSWAEPREIGVVEIDSDRREVLVGQRGVRAAASIDAAIDDSDFDLDDVLIAVKPQHTADVCQALASSSTQRVLSIAAGVTIEAISRSLGPTPRVIRAMPNTPALVGVGAAAIAGSANATQHDITWATRILEAVGTVAVVDEFDLDAVTGLSGSGPAYLFLLAESMQAAAVAEGLSESLAAALTTQTLLGAAALLDADDSSPGQLRANVTSPGGTTAAAIGVMQDRGLEAIVHEAIGAATRRSRELGAS